MVKKHAADTRAAGREIRKLPGKQAPAKLWNWLLVAAAAVGAFLVGTHLHHWSPHPRQVPAVDASSVTIVPSGTSSSTVFRTSDGRAIIISGDFGPVSATALVSALKHQNVRSVAAFILTDCTSETAAGLQQFASERRITGPIVTPFDRGQTSVWWKRQQDAFDNDLAARGLEVISWTDSSGELAECLPQAALTISSPIKKSWQSPAVYVKISYGSSSLLDIASLTSPQIDQLTDEPAGGGCRILLVSGQDGFVTRELLAEFQPDAVILTGSPGSEPGGQLQGNILAADSVPIDLPDTTQVLLSLPFSAADPVVSSVQSRPSHAVD